MQCALGNTVGIGWLSCLEVSLSGENVKDNCVLLNCHSMPLKKVFCCIELAWVMSDKGDGIRPIFDVYINIFVQTSSWAVIIGIGWNKTFLLTLLGINRNFLCFLAHKHYMTYMAQRLNNGLVLEEVCWQTRNTYRKVVVVLTAETSGTFDFAV